MESHGKFINVSDFALLGRFFGTPELERYLGPFVPTAISPGTYSKSQILEMFGYKNKYAISSAAAKQILGFHNDGKTDISEMVELSYIANSLEFMINDEAEFVVAINEHGVEERYIKNFAIEPRSYPNRVDKDFDFKGGMASDFVNPGLSAVIDPSGIGKTVNIEFVGKATQIPKFTKGDFYKEYINRQNTSSVSNALNIYQGLDTLIKKLWDSNSIKHLYNDKPIIYGTVNRNEDDIIKGTVTSIGNDISKEKVEINTDIFFKIAQSIAEAFGIITKQSYYLTNHLAQYVKNGIVYVTGGGNDTVTGTQYDDIMLGGSGNDVLSGEDGDDIIYGNDKKNNVSSETDNDTLNGGKGDDKLFGGHGDDTLDGGEGEDTLDGGDGYDTYRADKGDTIIDSDGKGEIFIDGGKLSGAERDKKKDPEGEYKSDDGTTYKWSGGDLTVNGVTIKRFTNGQFGINLSEKNDEEPESPPNNIDPLIIDMNGDGVQTVSRDKGAYFDLGNNGLAERTGWVDGTDAFLVLDRNGNGKIDNGRELFGTYTELSDGSLARNGFDALADFDSNRDGILDENDEIWSRLQLWQDRNTNGFTDKNELTFLRDSHLASINLTYTQTSHTDENNNAHRQASTVTHKDGTTSAVEDIWFDASVSDTKSAVTVEMGDDIKALPNVFAFGKVHNLLS